MFLFYLLLGMGLLFLLYAAGRWILSAQPRQLATIVRWLVGIIGGAVAIWLVVSGRLGQALMLATAMAPVFMRWKALWTRIRNTTGPTPGQSSAVETAWLRMSLDHDSGAMEGVVIDGPWKGRRLAEFSPEELIALLADCRVHDPDGAQIIETYLDRVAPDWRDQAHAKGATAETSAAMSRDEALRILGVSPEATPDDIREAHRRLMMKMHPDVGGSDYLAAKINQAKDVLLG